MHLHWKPALAALLATTLSACVAYTPAPGSERVKMTSRPADVQSCKAVGNIDGRKVGGNEMAMRNEVVGDGGDTLFITDPDVGGMIGIAYRCAKD